MSDSSARYAAIIPAYNEAATIYDVASRTLKFTPHVIVIDDGSNDGTAEALHDLPVVLLRQPGNLGKAAALWRGMQAAIGQGATAIITLDGDGQHEPESIPALVAMHRRVPSAIIIGSRLHDARHIPMMRYLANRVANFWISWAAGQSIADSQSGFRLYPTSLLGSLALTCDRSAGFVFESEVLIEAGRKGVRIQSVPVSAVYGRHLRRSHFRQGRDIARITRMVARKLISRNLDVPALIRSRRSQPPPPARRVDLVDSPRTMESRRRLLFVAEAVSLAHIARTVALAQSLDRTRYDIHLACDPRRMNVFGQLCFSIHPIRSLDGGEFQDRLAKGNPLHTLAEVRDSVKEDLRIIAAVDPAAVIGDFRLSLSISARAAEVPYMTVTNAHWSPYARPHFIVPELAIASRFGPRLGQALFSLIRPAVFAHHAWAANKVRREYGFPAVGYSLSRVFTEADQTVYADLPELVPTYHLPSHHHYIGPISWAPHVRPPWWDTVPEHRPMAYVSLGSSGRSDLLPEVLQALENLGIGALVSTAGRRLPAVLPGQAWISDYLPGDQAAARADLVICNGGSATAYQALAAGVPVLGIPNNLDQYLMMHYMQKSGAGEFVRAGEASTGTLRRIVNKVLHEPLYRRRAISFQTAIQAGHGAQRFAALVEDLCEPNAASGKRLASIPTDRSGIPHRADRAFKQPGQSETHRGMPNVGC
ncbi:MAG TPA: glycosyltransferase [Nitrospiraceae bacterium]|nr:glycosyltransferase [Nitrospiraceae bacterium]